MSAHSLQPVYRFRGLPVHLAVTVEQVTRALERGDSARARAELERVGNEAAGHAELLRLRGLVSMQQGKVGDALESYLNAAELAPDDALIACQLGAAQAQSGDMVDAEASFRRAIDLDPELPDAWYNLGHALDARADTSGACFAFERVLVLEPTHLAARIQRADMLKMLGRLAEAEAELRRVLARDPDSVPGWVGLAGLRTFQPDATELDRLLALHASGRVAQEQRVDFAFALASLLENAGRYAQAYELFVAANAGKRRGVRWNAAAVSGLVDAILERFARAVPVDETSDAGAEAIFLVGMPRSGSTLVEQILSAHPHVQGGGERNEIVQVLQAESQRRQRRFPEWVADASRDDWRRLGADYLARCGEWRDGRPRFTNKTLANWQTLGAIRRMLPAARIVHCRRDPLEMLWSCFKHHFHEGQFFSYNQDELVAFWRDEVRAMRVWSHAWPARILDFVHQDLLEAPETSTRALLMHCGLAFDVRCLAFHEIARDVRTASAAQVRQPLRRDRVIAARYGDLLAPLRERLRAAE